MSAPDPHWVALADVASRCPGAPQLEGDVEARGRAFARYMDERAEAWAAAAVAAGCVTLTGGSVVPLEAALAVRAEWAREPWCAEVDSSRGAWFAFFCEQRRLRCGGGSAPPARKAAAAVKGQLKLVARGPPQ